MSHRYRKYGHRVRFVNGKANVIEVEPVYMDQNFKGFRGWASETANFIVDIWEVTGYSVANIYTGKNTSMKVVFADEVYEDADFIYDAKSMDSFYIFNKIREYLAGWTVNNCR